MRLEYRRSPLRDVVIYSDGQLLGEASVVRPAVFAEFVSNHDVATWSSPCGFWATQAIDSYGTLVAVKEGVTVQVIDERL